MFLTFGKLHLLQLFKHDGNFCYYLKCVSLQIFTELVCWVLSQKALRIMSPATLFCSLNHRKRHKMGLPVFSFVPHSRKVDLCKS